jgi:hypothetical protein
MATEVVTTEILFIERRYPGMGVVKHPHARGEALEE